MISDHLIMFGRFQTPALVQRVHALASTRLGQLALQARPRYARAQREGHAVRRLARAGRQHIYGLALHPGAAIEHLRAVATEA